MASNKPLSKTKYSKCGYCSSGLLDQNLKTHCQEAHGQPKLVAGEKQITTFFPKKQRADSNDVHVDQDGGENDAVTKQSEPIIDQSEGKLDEILDRVKNIQILINESRVSPVVLPPMAKAKDMEPSDVRFKQLITCRSIQEITNIFGEFE